MTSGRVLVVEDDPEVARLLMTMLQMWGFEALHAATPQEAVASAAIHSEMTLVLCDVNLQGESGPSVVAKIRSLWPQTKVLFTSGSPFDILCESGLLTREALEYSATGYIQKPFLPQKLR